MTGLEELHVFQSQCDWWVATDEAEAAKMLEEHYGDTVEEMDEEFRLLPDDEVIKIVCDEDGRISDSGESVPRTAAEWAKREGRGLLASTEY